VDRGAAGGFPPSLGEEVTASRERKTAISKELMYNGPFLARVPRLPNGRVVLGPLPRRPRPPLDDVHRGAEWGRCIGKLRQANRTRAANDYSTNGTYIRRGGNAAQQTFRRQLAASIAKGYSRNSSISLIPSPP